MSHARSWSPAAVRRTHGIMKALRNLGLPLKAIARATGRHHATVIYHLRGDCRCNTRWLPRGADPHVYEALVR